MPTALPVAIFSMSNTDTAALLASLRDIHEPAAPEPGWPWLLLAVGLGIALLITLWLKRPKPKPTVASQQINAARNQATDQALIRLARLLRKYASTNNLSPRNQPQGDAWLQHLDSYFNTQFFSHDIGRVFGDALYRKPEQPIDVNVLCDQLQQLFEKRRPTSR